MKYILSARGEMLPSHVNFRTPNRAVKQLRPVSLSLIRQNVKLDTDCSQYLAKHEGESGSKAL